jgi:hypothetical protein
MAYIVPDGRDVKGKEIEIVKARNQNAAVNVIWLPCALIA